MTDNLRALASSDVDILVVGAGAAGLAAGIFAAQTAVEAGRSLRVVILEGAARTGAKILVSGGGRCNVTNQAVGPDDFNCPPHALRKVMNRFDHLKTVAWFSALGVELKCEPTGKLFPVTDQAKTVLEGLLKRCAELGVEIRNGWRVAKVASNEGRWVITHGQGQLTAEKVILATGGCSLPRTGSDGSGWQIARELGHTVTPTYPALVPLRLEEGMFHAELAGIAQEVELTTRVEGRRPARVDQRRGSLLWTHFGISGPVVLDASRFWTGPTAAGERPVMTVNFLPGFDFAKAEAWLLDAVAKRARQTLLRVVCEKVTRRLVEVLCAKVGVDPARTMAEFCREHRRELVHLLTELPLPIVGQRGWNYAEVTAGGVPLDEVDLKTMESRRAAGVYLAGEMLDCDGRIGGFNFQWAWATGYIAGTGAAAAQGSNG
ncbi:MAG: NAD(P)/FAD-dependent oxidoreductase [Phycisphaeraceae bacterium]|nr:NAD(P)/FAD-dependent oxidoreductase [Phycisphaeraceae bacterium]